MSTNVTMIAEVPIFELLDDEEREALAQMLDCRDFKAGENIFKYGEQGGEIYILRSWTCGTLRGEHRRRKNYPRGE